MPTLNRKKSSVAMYNMHDRWLYCVGGYDKNSDDPYVDEIEVMDLHKMDQWRMLMVKMTHGLRRVGCIPVAENKFAVVGGSRG